mgnify:CR=1 FL=1
MEYEKSPRIIGNRDIIAPFDKDRPKHEFEEELKKGDLIMDEYLMIPDQSSEKIEFIKSTEMESNFGIVEATTDD